MHHQRSGNPSACHTLLGRGALALTIVVALASVALPWRAANALDARTTAAEVELKAALIFKFTWFTTWPANSFANEGSPLLLCVAGDNRLADALINVVRGRTTDGRTLRVQRLTDDEDAGDCHVLYLGGVAMERLDDIIATLKGRPTLTISDAANFCQKGGIINLIRKGRRFSFAIYRDAADRVGLKLSSQLLKLSDIFHDQKSLQE